MDLSLTYDNEHDVWTLKHTNAHLRSDQDIQAWKKQLTTRLDREFGGDKVYLLIDASEFQLESSMAEAYGKTAKEIMARFTLDVFRYGIPDGLTATQVRLEAVINDFSANIYADREAALEALSQARKRARVG